MVAVAGIRGADSGGVERGTLAVADVGRGVVAELTDARSALPGAAIAAPGPCSSDAPHIPQKRCVSGFSLPQCGQRTNPPSALLVPNRLRYLPPYLQPELAFCRADTRPTRSDRL
jgi:hypothetical protein